MRGLPVTAPTLALDVMQRAVLLAIETALKRDEVNEHGGAIA